MKKRNHYKTSLVFICDRKDDAENAMDELKKHGFALTGLTKLLDGESWECTAIIIASLQEVDSLLEDISERFEGHCLGSVSFMIESDTLGNQLII